MIALIIMSTANAGQKFYKWTDENGNIHYSSEKPEDKQTDEVKVSTSQPKKSNKAAVNKEEKYKDFVEFNSASSVDNKSEVKEFSKLREQNCNKAKTVLRKFNYKMRMVRYNVKTKKKEYYYRKPNRLEKEMMARDVKSLKDQIKKYCNRDVGQIKN